MTYSRESMNSEQEQTERRKIQDAELATLVNPDHSDQLESIIKQAIAGEIREEEAIFAARRILIEVASVDTKTGLKKAEALKIRLARLMEYSLDNNIPLTIVYIDGDDFKLINDEMGHDVGDVAIFAMAQAIKETTRDTDIPARLQEEGLVQDEKINGDPEEHGRMGGDEFVLVLPGANAEQIAQTLLPRFRSRLDEITSADIPDYRKIFGHPITASAGIAVFNPAIDITPDDLIKRADEAMRFAKQQTHTNGTAMSMYDPDSSATSVKLI